MKVSGPFDYDALIKICK